MLNTPSLHVFVYRSNGSSLPCASTGRHPRERRPTLQSTGIGTVLRAPSKQHEDIHVKRNTQMLLNENGMRISIRSQNDGKTQTAPSIAVARACTCPERREHRLESS